MGIAERREREKTERRALIVNCAKELILEHGAEKVSMRDIARKAELSKATLYLYFSSKDMLFREICDEAGNRFMEYLGVRLNPGLSGIEIIKLFWNCYLDIFGESDDMIVFFSMKRYLAPNHPFPFLAEENDADATYRFYNVLKDAISRGIVEGAFDPDIDVGAVSRAVLLLFSNIIEEAARLPKELRDPALIIGELRKIFRIILRGIAVEGLDQSFLSAPVESDRQPEDRPLGALFPRASPPCAP
ncbi:MAG: TetR/AcrR family transcriptional regulator [Treponema sp.]|jgi:AcrR family transcriptional regulator|nr:TetR/AcrR family transcriptional regulator [Treponema sp.]